MTSSSFSIDSLFIVYGLSMCLDFTVHKGCLMNKRGSTKKVVMAHAVAQRWLANQARPEYRMTIYGTTAVKGFPSLLRSFRDGKRPLIGSRLSPIRDLGIREGFDSVEVWSGDRSSLRTLQHWVEAKGLETTGVL